MNLRVTIASLLVASIGFACSDEPNRLSREEMLDPEACQDCHPAQFEEWQSSMHAYAADDPIFLALNELGQEETAGELGDFCVKCHAPMAVASGATTDGLNLAEVPQHLKGITCFFCHTVDAVEGEHNNPLRLADDLVMRGEYGDAIESNAHASAYSPLHDLNNVSESSKLCGACHDIVLDNGVHLEATFAEWKGSVFNKPTNMGGLSCTGCHMPGTPDVIADVEGVPLRRRKEHLFPGIDVAVTAWPGVDKQLEGIARDLDASIIPKLCYSPDEGGKIEYTLDNVFAGHNMTSGASADRRMWVELVATRGGIEELVSGRIVVGEPVVSTGATDPLLWQIRDYATDANGAEAFFWRVTEIDRQILPPSVTNDMSDPRFNHSVTRAYPFTTGQPDRIEAIVHVRPVGLDILDELIGLGKLDASIRDEIRTIDIAGTRLVWTTEAAGVDLCVDPQTSAE